MKDSLELKTTCYPKASVGLLLFTNFRISITHMSPLSAATASCYYQ